MQQIKVLSIQIPYVESRNQIEVKSLILNKNYKSLVSASMFVYKIWVEVFTYTIILVLDVTF